MSSDFIVHVTNGKTPRVKVIHLQGELDEESAIRLKQDVDPLLEDQTVSQLIFDFSKLEFINSKGIGYLVSVHTHLAKDGKTLVVAEASEPVMDVITLVGLTKILSYYETLEEALSH